MCAYSVLPASLPQQASYFGTKRYTSKVDADIREASRLFSEKQHKDHIDDFESLWELRVTKQAAQPANGGKTTRMSDATDPIARMMGPRRASVEARSSADRPSDEVPLPPPPPAAAAAAAAASPAKPAASSAAAAASPRRGRALQAAAAPPASPNRVAVPATAAVSPRLAAAPAASPRGKGSRSLWRRP
jgi:hypothetical protein